MDQDRSIKVHGVFGELLPGDRVTYPVIMSRSAIDVPATVIASHPDYATLYDLRFGKIVTVFEAGAVTFERHGGHEELSAALVDYAERVEEGRVNTTQGSIA